MERRSFLKGVGLLIAAPAIVKIANIMPVKAQIIRPPGSPFSTHYDSIIRYVGAPQITFDGLGEPLAHRWAVSLYDDKGRLLNRQRMVFKANGRGLVALPETISLKPGMYYWHLDKNA